MCIFSKLIKISFILIHLVIGTICALYILFINDTSKIILIKWWSIRLLNVFNVKLNITTDLNKILIKKNYLIVSNHISWLDIFLINSTCPIVFVSKQSVSNWPFIGLLAKATDTIFIDRKKISKIKETTKKIEHHLMEKGSVVIFPEGTVSDGSSILQFKSNLFQTAINSKSDILPILIQYKYNKKFTSAPSYAGNTTLMESILNLINLERIDAKITILNSIRKVASRKLLARKAYKNISNLINK